MNKKEIRKILDSAGADRGCYDFHINPYYLLENGDAIETNTYYISIIDFINIYINNSKQKYKVYVYDIDDRRFTGDVNRDNNERTYIRASITGELCEAKNLEYKLTKIMKIIRAKR